MKNIIAIFCMALLSGCATLSKSECRNADWSLIGFEDASRGYAMDRIGQHRRACSKVDVVPDMTGYETGHKKGAHQYCTPARGYREGINGASYNGICPADLEQQFTRAYRDGQEIFQIKQRINSTASLLANYLQQIDQLYVDIASHEQAIVDSASSSVSRRESIAAIKTMQQQITELEFSRVAADQELIMLGDDYHALLLQHQQRGY